MRKREYIFQYVPKLGVELIAVLGLVGMCLFLILKGKPHQEATHMLGLMATAGFRMVPSFSRILNNLQSLRYGWVSVDVLLNEFKNHSQRNKIQKDTDESILEHAEVSFFNEVQVSNVSFSYSEDKAEILNDINLVIPKGEVIGMEGESGSGKSTIVNLILGLIDPTLGEIKVDGQKLMNSQIDQWQRMIGYVPKRYIFLMIRFVEISHLGWRMNPSMMIAFEKY